MTRSTVCLWRAALCSTASVPCTAGRMRSASGSDTSIWKGDLGNTTSPSAAAAASMNSTGLLQLPCWTYAVCITQFTPSSALSKELAFSKSASTSSRCPGRAASRRLRCATLLSSWDLTVPLRPDQHQGAELQLLQAA